MAYLSKYGYQNDIFVSYSQGDIEKSGKGLLKLWSTQAVELLRGNLLTVLDREPAIFIDESARPASGVDLMMPLGQELNKAVSEAALLLVLVSPRYLKSEWCKQELKTWGETLSSKAGPAEGRIALARVFKTDEQNWPAALQNQGVGFWFYDRADPEAWPWGWQLPWEGAAPNEEFSKEMMKLTGTIRRRLIEIEKELERRAAQEKEVETLKTGDVKQIYLHAREHDRTLWDSTSKELSDVGIEARPGQPEPDNAEEDDGIRSNLARIASRCEAMLLVGANPYALDDDLDLIGRDRREYIRSRHRKFLPCAVLDKNGGLRTDQRLRAARTRGIDWLDGTAPAWRDNLAAWLKQAAGKAADSYGVRP